MQVVCDRTAATLLPIIAAHVSPGTTVRSDQWAAYNNVSTIPGILRHETVNHSIHFLDPGIKHCVFWALPYIHLISNWCAHQ